MHGASVDRGDFERIPANARKLLITVGGDIPLCRLRSAGPCPLRAQGEPRKMFAAGDDDPADLDVELGPGRAFAHLFGDTTDDHRSDAVFNRSGRENASPEKASGTTRR